MVSRESKGFETTYNLTEPRNHSYIVGGTVVANCSEYVHLDNSSCNLASINLLAIINGQLVPPSVVPSVEWLIAALRVDLRL